MIREDAIPVCTECHCIMYKKKISVEGDKWLEGWACVECHKTIWEDINNDN